MAQKASVPYVATDILARATEQFLTAEFCVLGVTIPVRLILIGPIDARRIGLSNSSRRKELPAELIRSSVSTSGF